MDYYNKFLSNLANVLYPHSELLQKGRQWNWSKEFENVFHEAKGVVIFGMVQFNPFLQVKLVCDASPYWIGTVMSRVMENSNERPLVFICNCEELANLSARH